MKYEPMRHQQLGYDWLMSHEHAGLFMDMGLGKTVTTLTVLETRLHDEFTVRKALVIAPKNVAETVWAQETQKWDHLTGIRCQIVTGSAEKRRRALRAQADLYIINRENVLWLMEELGGKLPYEMVILDELSSFKSTAAKRWKALKKAIQSVRYVVGLTGTPAGNGYLDLYPEIYLLDGGERLGRTLGQYRDRYFTAGAHKGHIVYEYRLRLGAKDAIDRKLKDLCLSMSAADWSKVPPVILNEVTVNLSTAEQKEYDRLKREKVIPLLVSATGAERLDPRDPAQLAQMTNAIRGDTAATVSGKLLQMSNGAVYDDNRNVIHIHDRKLDALEEIIEANPGQNILLFYSYKHDLERIQKRFPQAEVFSPMQVAPWNAGKIPLLCCHPASAGHGVNLQKGGHIAVWFGLTFSEELYQQANARLHRTGQEESVIIHHIVAKGTMDERVMQALKQKDEVQRALLDALKAEIKKG